jgi:predicted N-acetyltransferase YhbS
MGSDHELAAITEAHNARMAGIDPLIPPGAVVPAVGDEFAITVDGGSAVARTQRAEAASLDALWGALTTYALSGIRVGADRPAAAVMEDLLTGWHAWVAEQPADPSGDTAVSLMWPSRDVEPVNTFLAHGMTPRIAIAARPAGRAIPPAPDQDVPIRPIEDRDLEGAVARYLDVVGWDANFGGVVLRPSAAEAIRADLRHTLASDSHSAWVAERDGEIIGLAIIEWPSTSGWIGALANARRVAYLGTMSVASGRRGAGVGSALSQTVHQALDAGGVDVTLLHHSVANPLSTPFWHRNGYRPLWTSWSARPHSTLR